MPPSCRSEIAQLFADTNANAIKLEYILKPASASNDTDGFQSFRFRRTGTLLSVQTGDERSAHIKPALMRSYTKWDSVLPHSPLHSRPTITMGRTNSPHER